MTRDTFNVITLIGLLLVIVAILLAGCARDAAEWRECVSWCARQMHVGTRGVVYDDSTGYCSCERAPDVDWVPKESIRD